MFPVAARTLRVILGIVAVAPIIDTATGDS